MNNLKLNLDLPPKADVGRHGGAWPLFVDPVEQWAWHDGLFTPTELDTIIRLGNELELVKGATHGTQDDRVRNSFVAFMFPNEFTSWVFERVAGLINEYNDRFFGFDLSGLEQGLQFTRYVAPGEHYEWHIDKGYMTAVRKLSLSIQLSDPADYKGGDLELQFGMKPVKVSRKRGMATIFPSYTVHRVKPVKEGTRYSLVAWVSGPPFR